MGKYESRIDFGTTLMHVRLNMNPFFTSVTQTIQAALFLSWEKEKKILWQNGRVQERKKQWVVFKSPDIGVAGIKSEKAQTDKEVTVKYYEMIWRSEEGEVCSAKTKLWTPVLAFQDENYSIIGDSNRCQML